MPFLNAKATSIFVLILIIISIGCENKYSVETAAIDSLIVKNKRALNYLQIDLVTINERKNEMAGNCKVLEKFRPDTSTTEFFLNFEKYKGILKIYTRFIDNYEVIFNRVRHNEKQLSSLRNSVMDGKISGSDYKLALEGESNSVNDNLANAEVLGNRIFQLEPDYQRLSVYFDPQVKSILNEYPELKALLENPTK